MNRTKIAKALLKAARMLTASMPSEVSDFEKKLEDYCKEISSDSWAYRNTLKRYWDDAGGVYSLVKKFIKENGAKNIKWETDWRWGARFKCVVGNHNISFKIDGRNRTRPWSSEIVGYDVRLEDFSFADSSLFSLTKEDLIKDYIDKRIEFLDRTADSIMKVVDRNCSTATAKDRERVENMLNGSKSTRQIMSELDRVSSNRSKILPRISLLLQDQKNYELINKMGYWFFKLVAGALKDDVDFKNDLDIYSVTAIQYITERDRIIRQIEDDAVDQWSRISSMRIPPRRRSVNE